MPSMRHLRVALPALFAVLIFLFIARWALDLLFPIRHEPVVVVDRQTVVAAMKTPWGIYSRGMIVCEPIKPYKKRPPFVGRMTFSFGRLGLYLNGSRIKSWRPPYVLLLVYSEIGEPRLVEVPVDERRRAWLMSSDLRSNSEEINRLDSDCSRIEEESSAEEHGRMPSRAEKQKVARPAN